MAKKNNFAKAIEWLRVTGKIKSQEELAKLVGTTPTTISRAKHGGVRNLSDDTLYKFNAAFGNVFNTDFLLEQSDIMLVEELLASQQPPELPDYSSLMNAALAAKDETIAALQTQLEDRDRIIQAKTAEAAAKDETIASLRQQLKDRKDKFEEYHNQLTDYRQQFADYRKQLDQNNLEKDEYRKEIAELRQQIRQLQSQNILDNPFPIGAAEDETGRSNPEPK